MTADASEARDLKVYVCPACKHGLRLQGGKLRCSECFQAYPVANGIPDFVREELTASADPVLHRMAGIDRIARIYETRLWYPVVMRVFGGVRAPSLADLVRGMEAKVASTEGRILDVACGPSTFGRRIASAGREIYGIDVSLGMLRQGLAYCGEQRLRNVHFARARVEALPFEAGLFDAALCCGSLHLFADTQVALREIARVMRPAAILAGFTFGVGRGGILRFRTMRDWYRMKHGLHVFEISELENHLSTAGFTNVQAELSGSILTFGARREEQRSNFGF